MASGRQGPTANGSLPLSWTTEGGAQPPWSVAVGGLGRAFARRVLARPLRIGSLLILGASVAVVVVGAQGWWIVLGVMLFQAAASGLVALWLESDDGSGEGEGGEQQRREPWTPAPRSPEPPLPDDSPDVPDPRVPDSDE